MIPTWQEDLESFHTQRKNLLKSLRYLEERASKVSKGSVNTFNELEDIKGRLYTVEARIVVIQNQHIEEIDQRNDIARLDQPIIFDKENETTIEENREVFLDGMNHQRSPLFPSFNSFYLIVVPWFRENER